MNCQRCLVKEVSGYDRTIVLYGDVYASLCISCINEHSTMLIGIGLWTRVEEVETTKRYHDLIAKSGVSPTKSSVEKWAKAKSRVQQECREIALEFIKPLVGIKE